MKPKKGIAVVESEGVLVSEECLGCGKPIAAAVLIEALCCSCRYGDHSWRDNAREPVDAVDYFRGHVGTRLRSGWARIKRHED
jgi:hypothetical protein